MLTTFSAAQVGMQYLTGEVVHWTIFSVVIHCNLVIYSSRIRSDLIQNLKVKHHDYNFDVQLMHKPQIVPQTESCLSYGLCCLTF